MGLLEARTQEKRDLTYVVMVSLMNSAVRANIDALGHDLAFKMFVPYIRLNAKWCVDNFPVMMGRDVKGIDGILAFFIKAFHMSNRAPIRCRLTEDGCINIEIKDCRTGGQFPNMCEWWCDNEQVAICAEINPEIMLTQEQCLSKGDEQCLWSLRGKRNCLEPKGLSADFKEVTLPDTPLEVVDFMSFAGPSEFWACATTNLVETIDRAKATKLLCTKAREAGIDLGTLFLRINGRSESDPAGTLLHYIDDLMHMEGKEMKRSDTLIEKTITKCPFSGCIPEVCLQVEAMRMGALSVVTPGSVVSYEEERGSDACHWRLVKKPLPKSSIKLDDEYNGMLKALKWRLVKGEITEEEFEKMRNMIS